METFISQLSSIKEIDPLQIEELQNLIKVKSFKKGTVLLNKGVQAQEGYFVLKGCLRSYTIDDKGKEHIYMFAPEGWLISDLDSQLNHKPSEYYIDAVEDCEIEVIDLVAFRKVSELRMSFGIDPTVKLLKRISVLQKRINMLMSANALERYEDFLQTYPGIVQRVPQKMIASYLGITPEALSKIRSDIGKPSKSKGSK